MGRRPLLVMVLGWFAVVGAVGAVTFVVVSNAGSGVGRASAAERVIEVPPQASESSTVTPTGTPTPSATNPSPSATPTPTPTHSRVPTPTTSSKPSQGSRPSSTPAAPRPNAPAVDPHTASFSTQGGIVVASCRGSRISLVSIRPADGWRVERSVTKATIEVQFKAAEREIQVYLRCVDGVPTQLGPDARWGGGDRTTLENPSSQLVHPQERVQSEGLGQATPTASSTPSSTPSSTEETPHG